MELFSDQENDTTDYAEQLVGEGKRFKDVAALAKAKVEADAFIKKLQEETAEMRATIKGEAKIDELFDRLKNVNAAAQGNDNGSNQSTNTSQNQNTPTSIKGLSLEEVQKLLDEREQETVKRNNLAMATQKVREAFGANAGTVLRAKAQELGMSEGTLTEMAKTAPQAFLKLVEAYPQGSNVSAPKSTVNSSALLKDAKGNVKNDTYWKNLRKEVGDAKFFTPALQMEMFRCAKELGDSFNT